MAAPKGLCSAYWPNPVFGNREVQVFPPLDKKEGGGLHAGLLLMWVLTFVTDVYLGLLFDSYVFVINVLCASGALVYVFFYF